jgi:hypothetical protein
MVGSRIFQCTDNESFIDFPPQNEGRDAPEYSLEYQLCSVVRTTPVRGVVWLDEEWPNITGDFRIFAFGITAEGAIFSTSAQLCDALERFYEIYLNIQDKRSFPDDLTSALSELRRNDGTELRPAPRVVQRKRRRPPEAKKRVEQRRKYLGSTERFTRGLGRTELCLIKRAAKLCSFIERRKS